MRKWSGYVRYECEKRQKIVASRSYNGCLEGCEDGREDWAVTEQSLYAIAMHSPASWSNAMDSRYDADETARQRLMTQDDAHCEVVC
jgi:hypothetical protein